MKLKKDITLRMRHPVQRNSRVYEVKKDITLRMRHLVQRNSRVYEVKKRHYFENETSSPKKQSSI